MARLFLALPIPEELRERLCNFRDSRDLTGGSVRWLEPGLWHLTLRFLGEMCPSQISKVTHCLDQATEGIAPLTWRCQGVGAFPNPKRARVLWAGVGSGREEVVALAGTLDQALAGAGFPGDGTPFRPHITLGRLKGPRGGKRPASTPPGVLEWIGLGEVEYFGAVESEEILLMESRLSSAGATYSPIRSWSIPKPS